MPVSHARTSVTGDDPIEVGLADVAELRDLFARLADRRKPRGIRHGLAAVLTALVFAVLAGAANYREAGDRIADLPRCCMPPPAPAAIRAPERSRRRRGTPSAA